jgi:hypothetical protein
MRFDKEANAIWLSANDTYNWAHRPGAWWPCSFFSGRRVVAVFESNGDLVDLAIDGGRGDQAGPTYEFNAMISDLWPRDKAPLPNVG